jgi:hypothetical protein
MKISVKVNQLWLEKKDIEHKLHSIITEFYQMFNSVFRSFSVLQTFDEHI